MIFSSISFLFYFLPILLMAYYVLPKKCRNVVLLVASLIFYFYGEPKYILLMLFTIIQTYILGILIDKYKDKSKYFLIISIVISIGMLIYFKYIDFIIENINLFLNNKLSFMNIALPIGISFYTFQLLSYIIDVYRGNCKVQKNIFKLALYISLFPQLIAGPIVRYVDVAEQIEERNHSVEKFAEGVRRFVIGLGKKVLIANICGEFNNAFLLSLEKSVIFYWAYGVSVMLQIYFDFSGYSDMAIGLGKMFGFDFMENFNYPYIAKSITDFWRRWHISLSSWFKDYVYIPLGGNRVCKAKWIRNIFIVWMLTGLWHGAEWNFLIWGLYFGCILLIEKLWLGKILEKTPQVISRIYVILTVMISFIIFNSESFIQVRENVFGLIGINNVPMISNESIYYIKSYLSIFLIGILGSTPLMKKIVTTKKVEKIAKVLEPVFLIAILFISTSYIVDGSFNPFLYFRF